MKALLGKAYEPPIYLRLNAERTIEDHMEWKTLLSATA